MEMKQYVISCGNLECECLFAMHSSQKSLEYDVVISAASVMPNIAI